MLRLCAGWILLGIASGGALYTLSAALLASRRFPVGEPRSPVARATDTPLPRAPVSVLRPLHGAEPGLSEALASSLRQDYPAQIQLVCGVQGEDSPAQAVVDGLRRALPEHDIVLVRDSRRRGGNPKISNLAKMVPSARHDILVAVDSDITTPPGWLASVTASMDEPQVGAVSCFYLGEGRGRWSRL